MSHSFLALSCLALLAMIGVQDYLVPALRNETISSGLRGPLHWWLDGTYLVLAVALCASFIGKPIMQALADIAALALILTAATNSFAPWVDKLTGGQHSLWHTRFTIVVFVSALVLQLVGDSGQLWWLTAANLILPIMAYAYFRFIPTTLSGVLIAASPAAEKLYVAGLCFWLIAWAL